jgi:hypothetical protein
MLREDPQQFGQQGVPLGREYLVLTELPQTQELRGKRGRLDFGPQSINQGLRRDFGRTGSFDKQAAHGIIRA